MGNIPLLPKVRAPQELGAIEAHRFPHLAEAVFDELDNKTLVECRRASRPWRTHLDQEKCLKIRIILSDIEKFHKVQEEWNRFLRGTTTEVVNRLGQAIKTSLMGNGRKQMLAIAEIFKEFVPENYTELASLAHTLLSPITQEEFIATLGTMKLEGGSDNIPR